MQCKHIKQQAVKCAAKLFGRQGASNEISSTNPLHAWQRCILRRFVDHADSTDACIMIIFDTETTGLLLPPTANLFLQPRIVELCIIELDDKTYEERGEPHTWLFDPRVPIPKETEKINGISDAMVKGKPTFEELLPKIIETFLGQRKLVAHNLPFDKGILEIELRRLDAVTRFPWPPEQVCTVALTEHIKGFRMNLPDMHEHFLGTKLEQTHRAEDDVRALEAIVRKEKW